MEVKIKPFDALPCAQMLESALDVGRCGWCE